MKVTLKEREIEVTVQDDTAITATDVMHLLFQAMLATGFQRESVVDALFAVAEEYQG